MHDGARHAPSTCNRSGITWAFVRPRPAPWPHWKVGSWTVPWNMTGPRCCCVWPASISSASEWYLGSEDYRRRILTQRNKGEALHGLREFLLFANKGTLRKKQEEELRNQAGCLPPERWSGRRG